VILTLQEDSVLRVYEDVDEAVSDVEALDAETTFRAIFDDDARAYRIEWLQPNTESRELFGMRLVGNGKYRFVATGERDVAALLAALGSASAIEPSGMEPAIRELERRLSIP
jgi:hypothetical protein